MNAKLQKYLEEDAYAERAGLRNRNPCHGLQYYNVHKTRLHTTGKHLAITIA